MKYEKNKISIASVSYLYLIVALMLITLGAKAQSMEVYTGLLITEYIIVLAPSLLLIRFKGYPIRKYLRLNMISLNQIIHTILIVIFSYPVAVALNFIGIIILDKFALTIQSMVPIPSTLPQLITGFIIIGLSPGICEEVMFRGLILNTFRSLGVKKAIIYSAILFGMFHFNVQNLLGPIYLGLIFGIIGVKTNSILAPILAHTCNNTLALIIGYRLNKLDIFGQNVGGINDALGDGSIIPSIIISIMLAFGFGLIVRRIIKSLPGRAENFEEREDFYTEPYYKGRIEEDIGIWDKLPIWIFTIIFLFWNYRIFLV